MLYLSRRQPVQSCGGPTAARVQTIVRAMTETATREAKQALRAEVKAALRKLAEQEMANESAAICNHVLQQSWYKESRTIGLYLHCARLREPDTTAILQEALKAGKRCYVPVVEDKNSNMRLLHLDDISGLRAVPPFGILEPAPTYDDGQPREDALLAGAQLDLLILPGLAFDRQGGRLGRGGGYYDKLLVSLGGATSAGGQRRPRRAALSFRAQVQQRVPMDVHDETIDLLVTPDGVHRCVAL